MKKILVTIAVLIIVIFTTTSCHRKSGQLVKQRERLQQQKEIKIDTIVVVPDKVGVTDMQITFTPYPDCDGGECYDVEFIIAVQIKEKLYQVELSEKNYTREKGKGMMEDRITNAKLIHSVLRKIPAQNVMVTLVNQKVIKICSKEIWGDSGVFTPQQIFWEKKW